MKQHNAAPLPAKIYLAPNRQKRLRAAEKKSRSWRHKIYTALAACTLLLGLCTQPATAQQGNAAVQEGNEAYKKGDYNAALKAYAAALEKDKNNTAALFNTGNALQKTQHPREAVKSYDEAINTSSDEDLKSKAYYNKALALLQQRNLSAAIEALKQSLRLLPTDNDARENLQKALNEQQKQQQQNQQNQQQKQQNTRQQQSQQQQKQIKMDKQLMEHKFMELRNQEKELQKQLQLQRATNQQKEKDW